MKVYHGSYTKIDRIDLSKCEIGKDFGQGFYVTKIREQAEFWAKRKGSFNETAGVVTEFEFNENAFGYFGLKTLRFERYNDEWLDFVVRNRNTSAPQPAHDCDIVEGPVADDKITTRIKDYLNGNVSKLQFLKELEFAKETHQICFCTVSSLQMLDYVEKDIANKLFHIGEKITEQLVLNFDFDEDKATDLLFSSAVFGQLENPATDICFKDWPKIYEMLKKELGI